MSKKIPNRDEDLSIDYAAEIALYAKLLKKGAKFTQPEFCEGRNISYHVFRRRMNEFRKDGNAPIEKLTAGKSDSGKPKKSRKKASGAQKVIPDFAPKDTQDIEQKKTSQPLPKAKATTKKCAPKSTEDAQLSAQDDAPECSDETDWESFPAFQAASISNFNVFDENKKLLQSCVEVLAAIVTKIKAGALRITKVSDVKSVTGAIRDVQATLEKLTPDYSRIGMQQEVGLIFDKLMKEEIDVVEAALTIEKTGMPLPDSIKILLAKAEAVEKEPEYETITEEQINKKRQENLARIKAEYNNGPAKIFAIQRLKEELRASGSFNVEADEAKKA
ncbi:hypothetical protein [Desulforegula conservatrix]|uniref:hypothetical protein n=1 Tax=Desulforegula conservatrix TaxID=153026 RepID=UPI000405592E|nr:hypothetical protein [Desulforegula conservatrix]